MEAVRSYHPVCYSVIILNAIDRVRNKRYNSIKIVTLIGLSELYSVEQIDQEIHDEY